MASNNEDHSNNAADEIVITDNPASRLHGILLELSLQTSNQRQNQGIFQKQAWSNVLKIEREDSAALIKGILAVEELGDFLIQEALVLELDEELYTDLLTAELPKIIHPINLNSRFESYRLNITPTLLQSLLFYSEKLIDYEDVAPTQNSREVVELISVVDTLTAQITFSELPSELRILMLKTANSIKESLSLFHINGHTGLKDALNALAGLTVLRQDDLKDAFENPTNKSIFDSLRKIAETIDTVTAYAEKMQKRGKVLRHPIKSTLEFIDQNFETKTEKADSTENDGTNEGEVD